MHEYLIHPVIKDKVGTHTHTHEYLIHPVIKDKVGTQTHMHDSTTATITVQQTASHMTTYCVD